MTERADDHFKIDEYGRDYAGDHLLIELWDAHHLSDAGLIEKALTQAAQAAGATVLHRYFHPFGEAQGVSGVVVLAESHISIHTWPERAYAAVDVFMCGDCEPQHTLPILEQYFTPARLHQRAIRRGVLSDKRYQSVA